MATEVKFCQAWPQTAKECTALTCLQCCPSGVDRHMASPNIDTKCVLLGKRLPFLCLLGGSWAVSDYWVGTAPCLVMQRLQ